MYKISKYYYPGLNKSIVRLTQEEPYRDFEVSFDEDVSSLSDSVVQDKAFKVLVSEFYPDGGIKETEKKIDDTDKKIDILYDIVLSGTNFSPTQVGKVLALYEDYELGKTYNQGDYFKYNGKVYEVLKSHSASNEAKVEDSEDLYKVKYDLSSVKEVDLIEEFVQPTGAHDAYMKGDRVKFMGKIYESLIDMNVQSPKANPSVWKEVVEEE